MEKRDITALTRHERARLRKHFDAELTLALIEVRARLEPTYNVALNERDIEGYLFRYAQKTIQLHG